LRLVGFLLTLNYDAQNHELKLYGKFRWTFISTQNILHKCCRDTFFEKSEINQSVCVCGGGGRDETARVLTLFAHILTCFLYHSCANAVMKISVRACLKHDSTRAETRFGLSAKRTSPFKLARGSVQSTTGSRSVRINGSNGSNAGYTMFLGRAQDYWLPTPLACFPFTSPTMRHRVPSHFN